MPIHDGQADWTLIMPREGQGIMGVASSSKRTPIKRNGFRDRRRSFEDADCYCSWQFVYVPRRLILIGRLGQPPPTP